MKNKYSISNNLIFLIRNWFKKDFWGAIVVFLSAIFSVLIPIVDAFITRTIVNSIVYNVIIEKFLYTLALLLFIYILLKVTRVWMESRSSFFQTKVSMLYGIDLMNAVMDKKLIDFKNVSTRSNFERAKGFAFDGENADGAWSAIRFSNLLTSIIGFLSFSIIFSLVSYKIIIAIILTSLVSYYFGDKLIIFGNVTNDKMSVEEMRLYYLYNIAGDSRAQKEVRLNGMYGVILFYLNKFSRSYFNIISTYTKKANNVTVIQGIMGFLRDAFTYYILIKSVYSGEINIGDFLFYLTLVVQFSDWMRSFTSHIRSIVRISLECTNYRKFLVSSEESNSSLKIEGIDSIELKDGSFSYDNEEKILDDISIKFNKSESVAIVGENGAGKTTLIKIISGLYDAGNGKVLYNGEDGDKYSKNSIFDKISILFQDYYLLPGTLMDNIDNKNRDLKKALKLVNDLDLQNKMDSFEDGFDTEIVDVNENEYKGFSGGELQRFLLLKSLMKDSDVLILDEPTAALDPISEEKLYLKYKEFAKDKISIFISHRMSSTRFCDKIIYMENGKIVEYGTYDELIKKNGKYKHMFDLQAKYYREG